METGLVSTVRRLAYKLFLDVIRRGLEDYQLIQGSGREGLRVMSLRVGEDGERREAQVLVSALDNCHLRGGWGGLSPSTLPP